MTENPVQCSDVFSPRFFRIALAFLSCAATLLSGCAARKKAVFGWNTAILVRPMPASRPAAATDLPEDPVPELQPEAPTFPLRQLFPRSGPARPHVSAPASNGSASEPEKLASPLIAPSLSAQETIVAQQQTNVILSAAEKNLAATRGEALNATQADLVSKIRGFLKDAREAAQLSDWSRARVLAKKAQVLSEDLASSF